MNCLPKRLILALTAGLLFGGAQAGNEPVATVNDTPIPAARAEVMVAEQLEQGMEDSTELREAVREELIRREVLSQAALAEALDEREDVRAQMELARQAILIRAYLRDYAENNPVTDEDVAEAYEQLKPQLGGGEEYKVRHILLESEAEAGEVIERLQAGEDFSRLAELSQDPGSRDEGGELGWHSADMFVGPFASALRSLEVGSFTETPVHSEFGYHVIKLDAVREVDPPALEDVSEQIRRRLQQQRIEEHMLELRAGAKID